MTVTRRQILFLNDNEISSSISKLATQAVKNKFKQNFFESNGSSRHCQNCFNKEVGYLAVRDLDTSF